MMLFFLAHFCHFQFYHSIIYPCFCLSHVYMFYWNVSFWSVKLFWFTHKDKMPCRGAGHQSYRTTLKPKPSRSPCNGWTATTEPFLTSRMASSASADQSAAEMPLSLSRQMWMAWGCPWRPWRICGQSQEFAASPCCTLKDDWRQCMSVMSVWVLCIAANDAYMISKYGCVCVCVCVCVWFCVWRCAASLTPVVCHNFVVIGAFLLHRCGHPGWSSHTLEQLLGPQRRLSRSTRLPDWVRNRKLGFFFFGQLLFFSKVALSTNWALFGHFEKNEIYPKFVMKNRGNQNFSWTSREKFFFVGLVEQVQEKFVKYSKVRLVLGNTLTNLPMNGKICHWQVNILSQPDWYLNKNQNYDL